MAAGSPRRLGVFGGTFNPIHNGHLRLLQGAREALELDRVLVIPTKQPPHKRPQQLASDEDRLAMCRLAVEGLSGVEVSDLEIRRGGLSYTADTLAELRRRYPDSTLYLLVGGDMFLTIDSWHESAAIARLAVVCGMARREGELDALRAQERTLRQKGFTTQILHLPAVEVSSTAIREKAASSGALQLPENVIQYINQHHLYGV